MDINGVAAVVTGGASGLGEATARELAKRGAKVAVFDRDAERGERVASEIGGVFCEVDVTSDERVQAAFGKARAAHGQERILVNCAGVANAAKTVSRDKETKAASLPDAAVRTGHPDQPHRLVPLHRQCGIRNGRPRAARRRRARRHHQHSFGRRGGRPNRPGSLFRLKRRRLGDDLPIARDLMGDGIRVNTILPGVFKTPMVAMMPPNVQEALGAQVPFPKRLGEAEEYARLACFLIENVYMNAATVRLDGGIRMAPR